MGSRHPVEPHGFALPAEGGAACQGRVADQRTVSRGRGMLVVHVRICLCSVTNQVESDGFQEEIDKNRGGLWIQIAIQGFRSRTGFRVVSSGIQCLIGSS